MRSALQFTSVLSLLALLSACAAQAPEPQQRSVQVAQAESPQADGPQTDVVCFYEAATGTNRKVRRCMSKEDYKAAMESAQRMGNEIKAPPPPPR